MPAILHLKCFHAVLCLLCEWNNLYAQLLQNCKIIGHMLKNNYCNCSVVLPPIRKKNQGNLHNFNGRKREVRSLRVKLPKTSVISDTGEKYP